MSTVWRTPRDNRMLIKSYSKRNKLLYNVAKEIKKTSETEESPEDFVNPDAEGKYCNGLM